MSTATTARQVTVANLETVCDEAFWTLKSRPLRDPGDMTSENERLRVVEENRAIRTALDSLWSARTFAKMFREKLAPLHQRRTLYLEARSKLATDLNQAQEKVKRTRSPQDQQLVELLAASIESLDFGCVSGGVLTLPSPLELAMPGFDFRKERPFRAVEARIQDLEKQLRDTLERVLPVLRELQD